MKVSTFASSAVLGALGLLVPLHLSAFGLGTIELDSALNEPLQAEIAVTALRGDEGDNLQVKLASNKEFNKAGLKRSFFLTQLTFEIVERSGKTVILVTSPSAVKEPFLDFLVIASTGNGRLIREYTLLLDPPKSVFNRPEKRMQKTVATAKPKAKTQTYVPQQQAEPEPSYRYSNISNDGTYGPTTDRDTLWSLAKELKPSSEISLNQMMMAMLNANKSAFINQNINALKTGYTLTIPTSAEINSLSKSAASYAVSEQNKAWAERNNQIANSSSEQQPTDVNSSATEGENTLNAELESTESMTDGQLKLVVPNNDDIKNEGELSLSGDAGLKAVSEQLTLAQETIETQAQENVDIKSRMNMMEEQLQTLRRLISLKDADLAKFQSDLNSDSIAAEELTKLAEVEKELTELIEVEELKSVDELESLGDSSIEWAENDAVSSNQLPLISDEQDTEITTPVEAEDAAVSHEDGVAAYFAGIDGSEAATDVELEPNSEESDVVEDELDTDIELSDADATIDTVTMPYDLDPEHQSGTGIVSTIKSFYSQHKTESLAGGLILLLGLIWLSVRGRKQDDDFNWDESDTQENEPVVQDVSQSDSENESEENVTAAVTENAEPGLTGVERYIQSLDNIDEVEVINEAPVEDDFIDLTKLDVASMEVEELDADSDELLEFNLDTKEPEKEAVVDPEPDTRDEDEGLAFELPELTEELKVGEPEAVEAEEENDDDLLAFELDVDSNDDTSLDNDTEEDILDISEHLADDDALDFTDVLDEPVAADEEIKLPEADLELPAIDEVELETEEAEVEVAELNLDNTIEIPSLSSSDGQVEDDELEFDLGDFDEIDEAETKLDLAAAYIDMGDPEGARNILNEVLKDGEEAQKTRAQDLLNDLS
ncbi:MAG: hypothetical protein COA90_02885 [Gammaproteobacteria bacterium]|nr:MAG: hypothetical protein COA90_02885 [Gammaproteobacteria bacterium]